MTRRSITQMAALLAAGLTLTCCASGGGSGSGSGSGSGGGSGSGSGATDGQNSAADEESNAEATAAAGTTVTSGAADESPPSADSSPSEPTLTPTTIPLQPSSNIDLPTATPEELANGPATTIPTGPLPIPAVALADVGQFDSPVELTTRPGDPRSFVVEQAGRVVAFDDLSTEVVLDMTDLTTGSGERGLLGTAFHPGVDLAYVHYTDLNGNTVVDEYAIDPETAVFDRASRREVLTVEQPFGNHNGGELTFGPDGYLYLGLGDGGSADDPNRNSLALGTRLGKILRIDPQDAGAEPFAVPPDNPFRDVDGADPSIWSLGLRNPWKFSFDSATGDLWIADVGQRNVEEINFAPATAGMGAGKGLSFGWSAFEGTDRFNTDQRDEAHTPPVIEYSHDGGACSVSGGAVYRGSAISDLAGWYVYGDFCSGQIWAYDPTSQPDAPIVIEVATLANVTAITVGGEGALFAISNTGTVSRFVSA